VLYRAALAEQNAWDRALPKDCKLVPNRPLSRRVEAKLEKNKRGQSTSVCNVSKKQKNQSTLTPFNPKKGA